MMVIHNAMVDISNLIGVDPVNTISWPDAGLMLGQRQRRWANIKRALGQHLVFAGLSVGGETDVRRQNLTSIDVRF